MSNGNVRTHNSAGDVDSLDDAMDGDGEDRNFVTALARGLDLLKAYQRSSGPLGNSELSLMTKIPKPTISRLTYTLTQLGYLSLDSATGKYDLSPAILSLGYPVLANLKIRHLAHNSMQQLANFGGVSVALATASRHSMIYVHACVPSDVPSRRLDVGSRVSMVHTAVGRAFLTGLSEHDRAQHYEFFAQQYPDEWPSLKARVEASIEQVRDAGCCLFDREWNRDLRAVGAPLVPRDGRVTMAINCTAPAFQITSERMVEDIGPRLVHLCQQMAQIL